MLDKVARYSDVLAEHAAARAAGVDLSSIFVLTGLDARFLHDQVTKVNRLSRRRLLRGADHGQRQIESDIYRLRTSCFGF
jgi:hypothetical protein